MSVIRDRIRESGTVRRDLERTAASRFAHLAPVFVCGTARSGTTLLASLLDSHPQVAVLPSETRYYHGLFGRRALTRMVFAAAEVLDVPRLTGLLAHAPLTFAATYGKRGCGAVLREWMRFVPGAERLGEWELAGIVRSAGRRGHCWNLFLDVYERVTNQSLDGKRYWAERTPGSERYATLIEALDPGRSRYLQLIRDPRAVAASWVLARGASAQDRERFILDACYEWARSAYYAVSNLRAWPDRYMIVRYEDLVSATAAVMHRVVGHLGISMDHTLLVPTTLGIPRPVNSSYAEDRGSVGTVVATQVDRYRQALRDEEICLVERELEGPMRALGYDTVTADERRSSGHRRRTQLLNPRKTLRVLKLGRFSGLVGSTPPVSDALGGLREGSR